MKPPIPHVTKLENGNPIVPLQFFIHVQGFRIATLNPGGNVLVDSSKVLKICRRLESTSWTIEILMNEQFSGLKLEAQHLLDYVVIVFEFKRLENGRHILAAKGVREKNIDVILRMGYSIGTLLGRGRIWNTRGFDVIAEAPPEYARTIQQLRTGDASQPESPITREGQDLFYVEDHVVHDIGPEDHLNTPPTTTQNVNHIFLFLFALLVMLFLRLLQL